MQKDSDKNSFARRKRSGQIFDSASVSDRTILCRFVNNKFCEFYEATIGAGYFEKNIAVDCNTLNLCIWDTAGQERFASLAAFYYRGTQAALVVFDVSKKQTFERAKAWINELNASAPANVIISLVGNKSDLSQREIMTDVSEGSVNKIGGYDLCEGHGITLHGSIGQE